MTVDLKMPSYEIAQITNLTVALEPVQDTSGGDPSPNNICPITGHSEVTVTRTGKNLADGSYPSQYNKGQYNLFLAYLQQGTYTLSTGRHENVAIYVRKSAKPIYTGAEIAISYNARPCQFTVSESGWYFAHAYRNAAYPTWEDAPITNVQLELGSTATAYEPYQGETYTISLGGTYYGGTLDVLNGVLTVDRAMVDLGTLTWTYLASNKFFSTTISGKKLGITEGIVSQYVNGGWWSGWADKDCVWCGNAANTGFVVKDTRFSDAATFKAAMSGVQFCYELATPTTVQLTAQEVETLIGINNVWSDSGDVTVTISGTTQTGDVVTVTALPQHKIQLFMP